jgi:hypothetical protein
VSLSSSSEGPGAGAGGDGKGKPGLVVSNESVEKIRTCMCAGFFVVDQGDLQPNGMSWFGSFDEPILGR